MITEQEAREAARQVAAIALVEMSQPVLDLLMWATCELARREAERAERAKPIDDEWFYTVIRGRKDIGPHCRDTGDLVIRETIVKAVTTRGQLLDLLKALKGEPA